MRFLCDMGMDVRITRWLRAEGHDAKHLREEGLHRLPNGEIFRKAIAEGRAILTFDLDFGEIAALQGGGRTGVVVLRLRNTRTAHVIDRLRAVIPDCAEALHEGALVSVEETRCRIRRWSPGEGSGS